MKQKILVLIILIMKVLLFSQGLELPFINNAEALIEKENYTLQYNEEFEQADWVAYELTREEVSGEIARQISFKEDPQVPTGSATPDDYKGSGYDMGHLAPAADMKMTEVSMSESFYMSNISPMHPSFNRGIWSCLESLVRTWAYEYGSVYVVTGPVLSKSDPLIGINDVSVPEYFYKVILDFSEPKAVGFILPNLKELGDLESYAMSIDDVEEVTGIDFFPLLAVFDAEEKIESEFDISLWIFADFEH